MKEFDLWLFDTLQFDVLENSLRKAALFYGENITDALLQNNVTLFLNDCLVLNKRYSFIRQK